MNHRFFVNGTGHESLLEAYKDSKRRNTEIKRLDEGVNSLYAIERDDVFSWVEDGVSCLNERGSEMVMDVLLRKGNDFRSLCEVYDLIQREEYVR